MPRPRARARLKDLVARKRVGALAGLVVALAAAGLAGAAAFNLAAGPGRTADPGPSAAAVATATLQPTGADDAFPNTAELALLDRLPTTVHPKDENNCHRETSDASPGASASVRCDLPPDQDASYVIYEQFPDGDAMEKILGADLDGRLLLKGHCATEQNHWEQWQLTETWAGRLLCYEDDRQAWVEWSSAGSAAVLARATRENADWMKLYAWWKHTSTQLIP